REQIGNIRVAEAEYVLSSNPGLRLEADDEIIKSRAAISADLKLLPASAGTDQERKIETELTAEASQLSRDTSAFLTLARANRVNEARALFMGDLDRHSDLMRDQADEYARINAAQGLQANSDGV